MELQKKVCIKVEVINNEAVISLDDRSATPDEIKEFVAAFAYDENDILEYNDKMKSIKNRYLKALS